MRWTMECYGTCRCVHRSLAAFDGDQFRLGLPENKVGDGRRFRAVLLGSAAVRAFLYFAEVFPTSRGS